LGGAGRLRSFFCTVSAGRSDSPRLIGAATAPVGLNRERSGLVVCLDLFVRLTEAPGGCEIRCGLIVDAVGVRLGPESDVLGARRSLVASFFLLAFGGCNGRCWRVAFTSGVRLGPESATFAHRRLEVACFFNAFGTWSGRCCRAALTSGVLRGPDSVVFAQRRLLDAAFFNALGTCKMVC
jgi:hypothetical protein